jgi:hypothetical protein
MAVPSRGDATVAFPNGGWVDAFPGMIREVFQEIRIPFIGKEAYLKNKHSSGRPKDIADIDAMGEL